MRRLLVLGLLLKTDQLWTGGRQKIRNEGGSPLGRPPTDRNRIYARADVHTLAKKVEAAIPALRRYARALTRSSDISDDLPAPTENQICKY